VVTQNIIRLAPPATEPNETTHIAEDSTSDSSLSETITDPGEDAASSGSPPPLAAHAPIAPGAPNAEPEKPKLEEAHIDTTEDTLDATNDDIVDELHQFKFSQFLHKSPPAPITIDEPSMPLNLPTIEPSALFVNPKDLSLSRPSGDFSIPKFTAVNSIPSNNAFPSSQIAIRPQTNEALEAFYLTQTATAAAAVSPQWRTVSGHRLQEISPNIVKRMEKKKQQAKGGGTTSLLKEEATVSTLEDGHGKLDENMDDGELASGERSESQEL